MAYLSDDPICFDKRANQLLQTGIIRQIEHRPMPAREEHGVVRAPIRLPDRRCLVQPSDRFRPLCFGVRIQAARIYRGLASSNAHHADEISRFTEYLIRFGELRQPDTGRLSSVHSIAARHNKQYTWCFHLLSSIPSWF